MTDHMLILAPQTVRVRFAIEPVLNATDTLLLLSSFDNQYGFPEWITTTRDHLPPQRKHVHELLIKGVKILDHEPGWPDFPTYVDHLAAMDPVELRDQALQWMCEPDRLAVMDLKPLDHDRLLQDLDAFLEFQREVAAYYQQHYADKEEQAPFDAALFTEIHALYNDPPRLQQLAVTHLRAMWGEILEPEWQRTLPMLEESVRAFEQLDFSVLTAQEAIRLVTGRDLTNHWQAELSHAQELVFVPSAHIGPYVRLFNLKDTTVSYLMFGARLPAGTRLQSPALSRSELLVRLNALADDTRLQILELLTRYDELCAQDIITLLDLSQSSASRHLRQLAATGYLIERRRDVAKCYSLNRDRVDDTLQACQHFLKMK
ncbi:MAG: metalloregulator ArsR/SmtB family transcription factor [Anaerolineae bacterium]|nr:metalloregulator ArsR/SmtB family transcription factor [Anaerolineae bacterium]